MGEDVTETLEVIPKSWKVIQHVREKFTRRDACSIPKCRKRFKQARETSIKPPLIPKCRHAQRDHARDV
jgi:transposase IS66-like protein